MKITRECPVPGMWWIEIPPSDDPMKAFHLMLKIRQAIPGLIVNTVGARFLWVMKKWP